MADLASLRAVFADRFGASPHLIARAPGRVNLIGEHTDYNEGFVLPMAIGGQTLVAARRRNDGLVRVHAADLDGACEFRIDAPILPDPAVPWSNYIRGVAAALLGQGLDLCGADLAITGSVPQGAGLSSSASLEVAAGLALAALAGSANHDPTLLALAGQSAEHQYAGCKCGIMDQLVSARAQEGAALLIDCRTLEAEPVALAPDLAVMIVHSGISRGLVEGEYNIRRAQCEAAARHFGVSSLRDLSAEALAAEPSQPDATSHARARHVLSENDRVLGMVQALATGDLAAISALMAASHVSMRDDFAITVPAIDALVDLLEDAIGGAGGARMTGGGFGGAVVAVVASDAVDTVRSAVLRGYRTPARAAPLIMVEHPQSGASLVG